MAIPQNGAAGGGGGGEPSSSTTPGGGGNQQTDANTRHRCCYGALFYSQAMHNKGTLPRCGGVPATRDVAYDLSSLQTESVPSGDFKYVCLGYSQYSEAELRARQRSATPGESIDLPYCEGLEVISAAAVEGPMLMKEGAGAGTAADLSPPSGSGDMPAGGRRPAWVGQPGVSVEEFPDRVYKTAGKIVTHMKRNLDHMAGSMRKTLQQLSNDIFGKGR